MAALSEKQVAELAGELLARRRAESSLLEFFRQAWHVLAPGVKLIESWHIDALAEHLEAVERGQIRRLLINVPPRTLKTLMCSVAFPTWVWSKTPHKKFLYGSYSFDLAQDASVASRRVIESQWYSVRWGNKVQLASDRNRVDLFANTAGGERIVTSPDATGTGRGCDIMVLDDPNSARDTSDAMLATVANWYRQVLPTRFNDPKTGSMIVVQQRVHEADVSGIILGGENAHWTKLILPMEFEPERKCVTVALPSTGGKKWKDPRRENGELLCPERIGPEELSRLKAEMQNEYVIAGQLQQRPAPMEGGIFKRPWVKLWRMVDEEGEDMEYPRIEAVIQSYDCAASDKTHADFTAYQAWGVFRPRMTRENHMDLMNVDGGFACLLLDAWEDRIEYPELRRRIIKNWGTKYGINDIRAEVILIEEKSAGLSVYQDLRAAGLPVVGYNPGKAGKIARANLVTHLWQNGLVYLPESKRKPGKWNTNLDEMMKQVLTFPNGRHDDHVDCMTQALRALNGMGFLSGQRVPQAVEAKYADDEVSREGRRNGKNPYAE